MSGELSPGLLPERQESGYLCHHLGLPGLRELEAGIRSWDWALNPGTRVWDSGLPASV